MRGRIASSVVVLVLAGALGHPVASAAPAGCAEGTPLQAARAIVHPQAELVTTDTVAGFESALVLEPLIYPGVRHRLVRAGGLWCEASALNEAWRLAGRPADAMALARATAQLAGAAHFDGVTVLGAAEVAPGLVSLETHALTNGIRARWTVAVDASGVRSARWVATGFAVEPFVAEWEGLSALPGAVRTYERSATGALVQQEPLLPVPDAVPEPLTEGWTADDFLIRITTGDSGISPNAGQDTGVFDVDFVRALRDVAVANYNEFYRWGFRKGWSSNLGLLHLDNSTGATCFACVFRSDTFNIHLTSQVLRILTALGWEYPDDRKALATVVGHEMFHNWQNAYGKPDFGQRESAFSEGTARMQETAHAYSDVSHQPNSLIYSTGRQFPANAVSLAANSCNGWDGTDIHATFANGPFTGKSYNACYFWLTWFGTHGEEGMVALLTAMKTHQAKSGHWAENRGAIEEVVGGSILPDLVAFASAALTDHGYTWADVDDSMPPIDWSTYLDRWDVATLAPGETATRTLRDGGLMARQIELGGYPSLGSSAPAAAIAQVRSTAEGATWEVLEPGACIEPPAEGEQVWLVGAFPETGTASITIGYTPLDPGLTACPEEEEETP